MKHLLYMLFAFLLFASCSKEPRLIEKDENSQETFRLREMYNEKIKGVWEAEQTNENFIIRHWYHFEENQKINGKFVILFKSNNFSQPDTVVNTKISGNWSLVYNSAESFPTLYLDLMKNEFLPSCRPKIYGVSDSILEIESPTQYIQGIIRMRRSNKQADAYN